MMVFSHALDPCGVWLTPPAVLIPRRVFLFCALVESSTIEPLMCRNRAKAVFFRSVPRSIGGGRIRCLWAPKNYVNAIECDKDSARLASQWGRLAQRDMSNIASLMRIP